MEYPLDPEALRNQVADREREENLGYRRAIDAGHDVRPESTRKAYAAKQKEFSKWCVSKGWDNRVSEKKVLVFLQNEIQDRAPRDRKGKSRALKQTKRRKISHEADPLLGPGQQVLEVDSLNAPTTGTAVQPAFIEKVGFETLKQYVNALVDMHATQKSSGLDVEHGPIRGMGLKSFLKARERMETERRRAQYCDRGLGTLLESYIVEDVYRLTKAAWSKCCEVSKAGSKVRDWMRTGADFFFGHSMLLRGDNRRRAELADMFTLPLPNEGPTDCDAVFYAMDESKTNKTGAVQYCVFLRHKDYRICPVSALAFYFYTRWSDGSEEPPNFAQREDWYNIPVFHGPSETEKKQPAPKDNVAEPAPEEKDAPKDGYLNYSTHLRWVNKLFEAAGLHSRKKTHAGRAGGTKLAELLGVSEAQIRRAGHWSSDVLKQAYLSQIPREFVRVMAGFKETAGTYFIPRAQVTVPASIEQQVWPWVDEWLRWYGKNCGDENWQAMDGIPFEHINPPDARTLPTEVRQDLSAQGFLRLLVVLRRTFFQDSVFLRKDYPLHPIFNNPLFCSVQYLEFAAAVEAAQDLTVEPEEQRLRKVLPDLVDFINTGHRATDSAVRTGHNITHINLKRLTEKLDEHAYRLSHPITTTRYMSSRQASTAIRRGRGPAMAADVLPIDAEAVATVVETVLERLGISGPTSVEAGNQRPNLRIESGPSADREQPEGLTILRTASMPRTAESGLRADRGRTEREPADLRGSSDQAPQCQVSPGGHGLPDLPETVERQRLAAARAAAGRQWSLPFDPAAEPYQYHLDRVAVMTVPDVWREWTIGIAGGPPIVALDRAWGARWRKDGAEAQMYRRRRAVILEILKYAGIVEGTRFEAACMDSTLAGTLSTTPALEHAVQQVEARRASQRWTLNKICKTLMEENSKKSR